MSYKITPQEIYDATNGGLNVILAYYPQAADAATKKGAKFKLREGEKTASATLKEIDGVWVVTDFGGDAKSRNCIETVRLEEKLTFYEALNHIAAQFNVVPIERAKEIFKPEFSERPATSHEKDGVWYFSTKKEEDITDIELEVIFSEKIISHVKREKLISTFKKYNFHCLLSYTIIKSGKALTFKATPIYPIFMFDEGDWKKLYQPKHFEKGRRFMSYGEKPRDYIFGLSQLKTAKTAYAKTEALKGLDYDELSDEEKTKSREEVKLKEAMIATGGSDGLNLAALGYSVLWLNSETAKLQPYQYAEIMKNVISLYNIPDMDSTGIRQAHELALMYLDIKNVRLPLTLKDRKDWRGNPCKDIKDYFRFYTPKSFSKILDSALPYKFWKEIKEVDKHGTYKKTNYQPRNKRLYQFLAGSGFYQMKVNNGENDIYVQIKGNLVTEISSKEIRKYINDFLDARQQPEDLCDVFLRTTQLNATSFENLPFIEIDFTDNDKNTQYLFFANKTWKITKEGVNEFRLGDISKFVWDDDVVKHRVTKLDSFFTVNHTPDSDDYEIEVLRNDCPFFNFLIQTARIHWRVEDLGIKSFDEKGKEYIRKTLTKQEKDEQDRHLVNRLYTIGYLLHKYKDPSRPWAVWAMESKLTEEGESNGGSGKSIMMSFPKYFHQTVYLPGKSNKLTENKHIFENVSETTPYVLIDDAHEYFNFPFFYPMLTGPWTIDAKNTRSFTLGYSQTPKIGVSSNFAPKDNDPSTERRILFTVLGDYYHGVNDEFSAPQTPSDDIGKNLFDDFTEEEWNTALNLGAQCIQFYLSHNKISPPMQNVAKRQLMGQMGDAFMAWADVYFSEEGGRLDESVRRDEAQVDFKTSHGVRDWSSRKFGKALRAWCKFNNHEYNPKPLQNTNKRIIATIDGHTYEMVHIRTKTNTSLSKTHPAQTGIPSQNNQPTGVDDDLPF